MFRSRFSARCQCTNASRQLTQRGLIPPVGICISLSRWTRFARQVLCIVSKAQSPTTLSSSFGFIHVSRSSPVTRRADSDFVSDRYPVTCAVGERHRLLPILSWLFALNSRTFLIVHIRSCGVWRILRLVGQYIVWYYWMKNQYIRFCRN